MTRFYFVLALLCSINIAHGQIPEDYFDNPLEIPLILSGSFGELRSNHFHSGLDIKTQQREGIPVHAPADGYISRIKVAHYGYGKALYIKHPNGYSTVYAHLQRYAGDIQDYVKKNQYSKETFELELFPEVNQIAVSKGDIIGYTGNTGSSGGPHLHYEIRDASSRPMNPMLFGVEIPDTKAPIVTSVFAYPMDGGIVNQSTEPVKLRLIKQKDGTYNTEKISASGKIGFGVVSNDQQNGASNKNGLYKINTTYNGEEKFEVFFEKFSFSETRFLNRYIDYGYFKENKSRIQKLFREPNNPLSIINYENNNGFIDVENGFEANYNISLKDFKGNETTISIPIMGVTETSNTPVKNTADLEYVQAGEATTLNIGKFTVYIPAKALYQNEYLDIKVSGDTLYFHNDNVPIHKNISISIDISNYAGTDKDKMFIGRLNWKGQPYYNSTRRKGNVLTARTRTFGDYTLSVDTIAPKVRAINFKDGQWISKNNTLKVKITDDLSGISKYRATINGKFILMEYNYKKNVLTYDFDDEIVSESDNNLKLIVTDNVGNSTTFEAQFFRKNI